MAEYCSAVYTKDVIAGLIRAADGSEVLEQQLEDAQAKAERLNDLTEALSIMSETAAQCYELQTGNALDVSRFDAAPLIAFIAAKETNYGIETNG